MIEVTALRKSYGSFAAVRGLTFGVRPGEVLGLVGPNGAVLFFPGWFQTTRSRGGGPEVVGQRLIFFFAQTPTMVLALIPALLIGAVPFAIASFAGLHSTPVVVGCIFLASGLMLVVLLAEVAAGVRLLGTRFERLDLSAELRP